MKIPSRSTSLVLVSSVVPAHAHAGYAGIVTQYLVKHMVPENFDFSLTFFFEQMVLQDFLGT